MLLRLSNLFTNYLLIFFTFKKLVENELAPSFTALRPAELSTGVALAIPTTRILANRTEKIMRSRVNIEYSSRKVGTPCTNELTFNVRHHVQGNNSVLFNREEAQTLRKSYTRLLFTCWRTWYWHTLSTVRMCLWVTYEKKIKIIRRTKNLISTFDNLKCLMLFQSFQSFLNEKFNCYLLLRSVRLFKK